MVRAAISSEELTGAFFRSEKITATRYLDNLCEFVAVQNALEDTANSSLFMQDGVRPHHTAEDFNFLNEHFYDIVITLDYTIHIGRGLD